MKGPGRRQAECRRAVAGSGPAPAPVRRAAANPMSLGKVVGVKDALPRLTNAVTFAADSAPKRVKALRGASVKVTEVKSSAEAVPEISPAELDA
ncbi:MAG: hypothetical protein MZW92_62830 [Comamonadaceae bacterium]|nr:hypothetical protein [Comamonadaceae bacterium]